MFCFKVELFHSLIAEIIAIFGSKNNIIILTNNEKKNLCELRQLGSNEFQTINW